MGTVSSGLNRGIGWYSPKLGDNFSQKYNDWLESVELFKIGNYQNLPEMVPGSGCRTITGSDKKVISRKKAMPLFIPWFEQNF